MYRNLCDFLLLIFLLKTIHCIKIRIKSEKYQKVLLDEEKFVSTELTTTYLASKDKQFCLNQCLKTEFCSLACYEPGRFESGTDCFLSSGKVIASYQDSLSSGSFYTCYTPFILDILTQNAVIAGSKPQHASYPAPSTTLLDGIYLARPKEFFVTVFENPSWVVIDLGQEMDFSVIQFVCSQESFHQENTCFDIYIKTSSNPPIIMGDFSSFDDFGALLTKKPLGQLIRFEKPTQARYICFFRNTSSHFKSLFLMFINVY